MKEGCLCVEHYYDELLHLQIKHYSPVSVVSVNILKEGCHAKRAFVFE